MTARDIAARKRGQVRFAWLTKTRPLRDRGGYFATWADDIVQHAVDGRTSFAIDELDNALACLPLSAPLAALRRNVARLIREGEPIVTEIPARTDADVAADPRS